MSSLAVRNSFRSSWASFAGSLPYVEAINTHPGSLPERFGTLTFEATTRRDVTMGSQPWVVEEGTVTVAIFTPSGSGDAEGIGLASEAARLLLGKQMNQDLRVLGITGPVSPDDAGEGEFYENQIGVQYEYQYRDSRP